jgi:sugar phosphate isomerase/epimerase
MLGDPLTQSTLHDSEHIPRQQAYEIFVDTVRDLASYGQTQGVTLLLENNVVSPLYLDGSKHNGLLMSDAEEISRCMDDVSDTNVGLLLDVGHLKVSANALNFPVDEFINRVGPYVGAIHLSENNGIVDNNQPLSETHWFLPLLHDFQQLPWIIEVYHLDSSGIEEQISILEHCLSG